MSLPTIESNLGSELPPVPSPRTRLLRPLTRWARATAKDLILMGSQPRTDLVAGLTVAIVALPLALGFGVASGMGAAAGLATAIVAGALAAIFGGSNIQVSGPTGAMTVILVPIVHQFGPEGLLTVGLMAGVLLLGLAVIRAGRFVRYVPKPVEVGFTAGIAFVIFCQQMPTAFGQQTPGAANAAQAAWEAVWRFAANPHWPSLLLAASVATVTAVGGFLAPRVPFSLIAVTGAALATFALDLDVARIGALPATLPSPSLAFLDLSAIPALVGAAATVAAIGALESLLSATMADASAGSGTRHDPDRELFGQGIANLAAPLFGGVPATAAIARTAVNVQAGGRTRLSALTHAAVLALIMLAAAPLVSSIPVAALAGVLIGTTAHMVKSHELKAASSSWSDVAVLLITALATVALDLVAAVGLGLAVACVSAVIRYASTARLRRLPLVHDGPDALDLHRHVTAFQVEGPLIFAGADPLLRELVAVDSSRIIILRLQRVLAMDSTGACALREIDRALDRRGVALYLCDIDPKHTRTLDAAGALTRLRTSGSLFATADDAVDAARTSLQKDGTLPSTLTLSPAS